MVTTDQSEIFNMKANLCTLFLCAVLLTQIFIIYRETLSAVMNVYISLVNSYLSIFSITYERRPVVIFRSILFH